MRRQPVVSRQCDARHVATKIFFTSLLTKVIRIYLIGTVLISIRIQVENLNAPAHLPTSDAALDADAGQFESPIRSKDLFNERSCVFIEHEGMIYALRATRAGKLILTK
ncbi:MAG: hemin uptake protein HemP [Proteobacteria bacterium]|nr:hemin uptake protein HemP [Pseudomonadota bacterium]